MDKVPKGVYLYGDVGTGKTMLMDLFLDTVPLHLKPHAKRIHFHAFMLDVLQRQHAVQTHYASLGREHLTDATPEVARQLAEEARILCFDEFQVRNPHVALRADLSR
jgi:protein AFG1